MTTINPQIDAAVLLMKARAAEFDGTPTTPYPGTLYGLVRRIHEEAAWVLTADVDTETYVKQEALLDTMNLCALALSVLPKVTP